MLSEADTIFFENSIGKLDFPPMTFQNSKNKVWILEEGITLYAKAGDFKSLNSSLFTFKECENIEIVGNGGTIKMLKNEYLDGEWRHGISLRASNNIKICDLTIKDSGGDGIYIAGLGEGTATNNVIIENIISTNNKRQGLSIISGRNIKIINSKFTNTKGTLPGAGLDIEPNRASDKVENIIFDSCVFKENDHAGIVLGLGKLTGNSEPISVSFLNCIIENNHNPQNKYVAAEIVIQSSKTNPVKGNVLFNNCVVQNSSWGMLYSRKTSTAFKVSFNNCIARNINRNSERSLIGLEIPDYRNDTDPLGGFSFDNFYWENRASIPIIFVHGSYLKPNFYVEDLIGNFTLKNNLSTPIQYLGYNAIRNKKVDIKVYYD